MNTAISRAINLRLQLNIYKIKIEFNDIINIAEALNYKVYKYSEAQNFIITNRLKAYSSEHAAFSTSFNDQCCIFFDDKLTYEQKIVAIAHEIGHAYCNHHSYGGILGKSESACDENEQETEADNFVAALLAPPCILYMLDISSGNDIMHITGLNEKYAKIVVFMIANYSNRILTTQEIEFQQKYAKNYSLNETLQKNEKPKSVWKFLNPISAYLAIGVTICLCTIVICFTVRNNNTGTATVPAAAYSSEVSDNSATYNSNETVYVTKSGGSFHLENCRHIENKNTFKMTRKEAAEAGYSPCKDCMP